MESVSLGATYLTSNRLVAVSFFISRFTSRLLSIMLDNFAISMSNEVSSESFSCIVFSVNVSIVSALSLWILSIFLIFYSIHLS